MEIWKEVPEYPRYQVSNLGRVLGPRGFIAGSLHKSTGYLRTLLRNENGVKEFHFHRIVASAFLGKCPKGYQVNHINCDKLDNRPENLEYITLEENLKHAWENGLGPVGKRHGRHTKPECTCRGEKHPNSIMTEKKVIEMRKLRKEKKLSFKELSSIFGISKSQVSNIINNKMWKNLK